MAGMCGSFACPTDDTKCGNCIQAKCCMQAAPCLVNPSCNAELTCLIACVHKGGKIGACVMQCGVSPDAVQASACVAMNCGKGICI
jgi:hypothetical protein